VPVIHFAAPAADAPPELSVAAQHGFTCRRDYKAWRRSVRGANK
jgi:hypothetical protein